MVNPLILPACVAYFAVVWLLERHQHCYVWSRAYDSGGKLWSQVREGLHEKPLGPEGEAVDMYGKWHIAAASHLSWLCAAGLPTWAGFVAD